METAADSKNLDKTKKVVYSRSEVAQHTQEGDIWVIIENDVYDLSQFLHRHPGGPKILQSVAGQDATKKFKRYHRLGILASYKDRLLLGEVEPTTQEPGNPWKSSIFAMFRRS